MEFEVSLGHRASDPVSKFRKRKRKDGRGEGERERTRKGEKRREGRKTLKSEWIKQLNVKT